MKDRPVVAVSHGHGGEVRFRDSGLGVAWCGNNCQVSLEGTDGVQGYEAAQHIATLWNGHGKLEKRVSQLRESLIKLRDCDWVIRLPDRMDAVREIAREALERDGE